MLIYHLWLSDSVTPYKSYIPWKSDAMQFRMFSTITTHIINKISISEITTTIVIQINSGTQVMINTMRTLIDKKRISLLQLRGSETGVMSPLMKTIESAPITLTTISRKFNQLFFSNRTNLNTRINIAFWSFSQVKREPPICRIIGLAFVKEVSLVYKTVLFANFDILRFSKTFVGSVTTVR